MIRFTLLIVTLLYATISQAQASCSVDKLPQTEKALLQKFADELRSAVNSKNKEQLANLFTFPFTCSYCIIDSAKANEGVYEIKVNRKQLLTSQYEIFFTRYFVDEANQKKNLNDFFIQTYNGERPCSFIFLYPLYKPTTTWEGMQGALYIKKIKGQYKIAALFTIP